MKLINLVLPCVIFISGCSSLPQYDTAIELSDNWKWKSGIGDPVWYINNAESDSVIVGNCRDYAVTLYHQILNETGTEGKFLLAEAWLSRQSDHVYLCFGHNCYDQNGYHNYLDLKQRWYNVRYISIEDREVERGNRFN